MTVTNKISTKDAFQKGYLENKKVYLQPIIRGGRMVTQPEHVAYFQYEGASNWFSLPVDTRNVLINPFDTEEEKEFFEGTLDTDLSIHKKLDNFWHTFYVKVVKDYVLMSEGFEFDLADPIDNLRYRVIKHQPSVAPDLEHKYHRAEYRFALVEEGYEDEQATDTANYLIEAYTYLGTIQSSAVKMRDFLGLYLMETNADKLVPMDADKKWLLKEIKQVIEKDIKGVLKLAKDSKWENKKLIFDAIVADAIIKEGRNKYKLPGEGVSYTYPELIKYLEQAEKIKSDVYLKLKAQVKMYKK